MPIGLLNNQLINDLRTSLLNRNLNPTAEANLGGVGSSNNDRGLPTTVDTPGNDYVPNNQDNVTTLGYYQLKNLSLINRYAPVSFQQVEIVNNLALAGNIGTYESYTRTIVPPNFNIQQYVLSAPNFANYSDTPLGLIGLEQLKFSLEANINQNTIKNTVGRINTNLFSLLKGEEFLIRDYQITELPNNVLGFFANLAQKYSGIEIPISTLPRGTFGFVDDLFNGKVNYANCNLEELDDSTRMGMMGGIYRNDGLLRRTGRGNRVQLFNLLGTNKYRPNYNSQNGGGALNRIFGFLQQQRDNDAAAYTTLEKTRRSTGTLPVMGSMGIADPANEGGSTKNVGKVGAFIQNDQRSVLQENGLPKITWDNKDKAGDFKRFMFSIENLAWIGNTNGLPECEIGNGDYSSDDTRPGRIMWFPPYDLTFDESVSVAWDKTNFIGRGEPVFTYNNTVRTGSIKFKVVVDHPSIINELRKSNYSDSDFKKFFKGCKTPTDYLQASLNYLNYQSGETNLSEETRTKIENEIYEKTKSQFKTVANDTSSPGGTDSFSVKIFFPNASSQVNPNYDSVTQTGNTPTTVDSNLGINTQNYENSTNFNLNSTSFDTDAGFQSPETTSKINNLVSKPDEIKSVVVTITISNTNIGGSSVNETLGNSRYESTRSWISSQLSPLGNKVTYKRNPDVIVNIAASTNPDTITEKQGRYSLIEIETTKADLKQTVSSTTETKILDTTRTQTQDTFKDLFINRLLPVYKECDYFFYLEKNDPFVYDKFRDKIKYFHPGFHSTTPEGLNSRLTFLHQCTRQGPAISENAAKSNLAFGRPPILILRIGDFFHTKMVIESMSISYDEGVLWDLNPEGIGVQPRLASVNLTVSYLGGQSLLTPVRELQNALGFHFYANTETFQHAPKFIKTLISAQKVNQEIISETTTSTIISETPVPPETDNNNLNNVYGFQPFDKNNPNVSPEGI
jgi:hypothetical protein